MESALLLRHDSAPGQQAKERKKPTALEIVLCVDALPCARTTVVDTARDPPASLLYARAAAEPAPAVGGLRPLRRTCALGHALAVADFRGLFAYAIRWVDRRGRRESVRALERAGVSLDADGLAVCRVDTMRRGGGFVDLRDNFFKNQTRGELRYY